MITIRSPLRISLGGGGTDLLSYSMQYGGFCVSAAISKYSYVSANYSFFKGITAKYTKTEIGKKPDDILHPIFREALKDINLKTPQIEIVSVADVPSDGAGLGNSGAFTVSLLKALYAYKNIPISQEEIAEKACNININILKKAQGKQDEYISALGGITCLEFNKDGSVTHYPLNISHNTLINLEENFMLLYTGIKHDTQSILSYQEEKTKEENKDIIENLNQVKEMGKWAKATLEKGNVREFAEIINRQWELKESRMPDKNYLLHTMRNELLENGAIGVKIVGSGLGGFFLVYAKDKYMIREYARRKKLDELRFTFDFEGCKRMI